MKRKTAAAIFLILALLMVLFFTFQNPEKSRVLSETVRDWLGNIGIEVKYQTLRSNVHILEYIIVGLALTTFCRNTWIGGLIGCGIGLLDECLKIFLPGREFSSGDLIRDFIGVVIATVIVTAVLRIKHSRETETKET